MSRPVGVAPDFGLLAIAKHFDKTDAVELYWDGALAEAAGDLKTAVQLYKKAYRGWPALDSQLLGGLPKGVRDEVDLLDPVKKDLFNLLAVVSVPMARASKVCTRTALLTEGDRAAVERVRDLADLAAEEGGGGGENHDRKKCVFLNDPQGRLFETAEEGKRVLAKLVA